MRNILFVIKGEIIKQHHNSFNSYFTYFSLFIWPILGFLTIFYSYKPFKLGQNCIESGIYNEKSLLIFLLTGLMAYSCFSSMVQSSWQLGWLERQSGTLEISFLSPANRLAMVYGKALGAFLQDVWMFAVFCIVMLFFLGGLTLRNILLMPLIFILLIVASTIWGGMMNTVFLFSRDASIVMNIIDDPMVLFSGVRIPISTFPLWAKLISSIFPLTYCINIVRNIFTKSSSVNLLNNFISLFICLTIMISITLILLRIAERNCRKTGSLNLY